MLNVGKFVFLRNQLTDDSALMLVVGIYIDVFIIFALAKKCYDCVDEECIM